MKEGAGHYLLIGLGTVVVAAVIGGLIVLGPPSEERGRRIDQRRVEELGELGREVDYYRSMNGKLPSSLDEMERARGFALNIRDPDTQQPYEYRVLDSNKYELCAKFQQDSTRRPSGSAFWRHDAGRQCFALTVREVFR